MLAAAVIDQFPVIEENYIQYFRGFQEVSSIGFIALSEILKELFFFDAFDPEFLVAMVDLFNFILVEPEAETCD